MRDEWAERQGAEGIVGDRARTNQPSLDGLPALADRGPERSAAGTVAP